MLFFARSEATHWRKKRIEKTALPDHPTIFQGVTTMNADRAEWANHSIQPYRIDSPGWQASLHRAEILRDLCAIQAVAAELSGYAGKIPPLFEDRSFKAVRFDSFILKQALRLTRSVCLRAF
jgi:hypothetical protein